MADGTAIEWTDATWNPIRARHRITGKIGWHCEHDSEGCRYCYAEGFNHRLGTRLDYKPGHRKDIEIFLDEKMLLNPLRWKKPRRIFPGSMTDLFADFVTDEMLDRIFAVMALCPQHRFQVLTKRAKRMRDWMTSAHKAISLSEAAFCGETFGDHAPLADNFPHLAGAYGHPALKGIGSPLPNVWLGVSAEDQANWDERKEHLRNTPAAVHFASFEPLLGPIVEPRPMSDFIQWAIVGGESGPHARPMHPDWARSLRDQCQAVGVPFFFKQWGQWNADALLFIDLEGRSPPPAMRVGKKLAGRLLDGVEHNGMPGVTT